MIRVLVDGGVVNNYPVDEVRNKGVDIVIGVDVQDSLKTRKKLKSAFDVLVQINNYRTIKDMAKKRGRTDIYINPNIKDFSVVSFSDGEKIIQSGEDEANTLKEELKAVASKQKEQRKQEVDFFKKNSIYINTVEIKGNENYTRAYILGKLKLKVPAEITYDRFNEGVNNLSATGNFQDINYRLITNEDKTYKIVFTLRENESKMSLRLGAHYDDLFGTAALMNVTRKRVFTNNDIASFDFVVGDNIRYNFNYYIDKGFYWSIGLNSQYSFFSKDVNVGFLSQELPPEENSQINKLELEYGDLTNQIFVETLFRRSFLLGAGLEHKWLRYLSETIGIDENGNARTLFENTNYVSTYGYLRYDTFNNSFFPKQGVFFNGDFHLYLFAEGENKNFDQFSVAKAEVAYAQSFTKKLSAVISTEGGFKIGDDSTRSLDFFLGGYGYKPLNNLEPFYGYEALSLRGDTYLKSSLTVDYELFKKNHINIAANIANIGDDLFTEGKWIDGVDYSGFAVGYGMETFLGPLQVKWAFSPERDESEWHITAGFRF